MRRLKYKISTLILIAVGAMTIVTGAIFLTKWVIENNQTEALVSQFGYLGITIIGIIAGLNTFIPIPAASLTPAFISLGFSLPLIIVFLSLGTIIADYLGYILGHWSREVIEQKYPKTFARFTRLASKQRSYLALIIFLYAALIPFPNEAIIIPLALAGIQFRLMIIPLLFGNAINHTLIALGATNIVALLFG